MEKDISNYRFYFITAVENTAKTAIYSTGLIPVENTCQIVIPTTFIGYRDVTSISGTSCTFANGKLRTSYGQSTGADHNDTIIPVKIYGVK